MLWFHLWLDALWVLTGVSYIVLLFATGQWVRIVPTDWAVVPNAISAALQYASLDWPIENSWVVYNALQQLAYFTVVFIASPLAIAHRPAALVGLAARGASCAPSPRSWRARCTTRSMLFFLAFTFVHVVLVLTTGALASSTRCTPRATPTTGSGFVVFALSVAAMVVAWVLAKPPLLKRIAAKTGRVQG